MNIAIFVDCYPPMKNGVITSVLQLREGLENKGHHVVIVSVLIKGSENKDPNVLLIPQIPLDFGSKQGFGYALVNQIKVLKFLKKHKIELIHVHSEGSIAFSGRNAALKLGLPRVTTTHTMWEDYHNYLPLLKIKPLVRRAIRILMKGTSVIVSPSIKSKKYNAMVVPEYPLQIIPNGIDMKKFKLEHFAESDISAVRSQYGLKQDDKLLIFVGRLGPEKRVGELLKAVVPLLKKHQNIKMLIVGDGPAYQHLVDIAREEGVSGSVVFTGFVDWDQAYRLYSIANLFVTASLSEVHPMTLIEGAICGLPSVCRRDDSYLDLVHEGKNGYLADTDEEMCDRIENLILDDEKLKIFSKNALEISQLFSAENHVTRMEKLYKKVLEFYPDQLARLGDEHLLD